jgi:AcrR family transcriptional regulator
VAVHESDRGEPGIDDELLGDEVGDRLVHEILARELGEQAATVFAQVRALQEAWQRRRRPGEGLRERKKRLTRQRISDVATALCVTRGFEHVRVAEIAELVGVSEKTVYNYFPTKESMVFDMADEGIERLVAALRERDPRESPTAAVVRLLREDIEQLDAMPAVLQDYLVPFTQMIHSTPSLRAAWLELHARLTDVAAEELAAWVGVDPREPEPSIAAHALVGLQAVVFDSRLRHVEAGLRGAALHEAIDRDLDRAARLLEIGLASFDLLTLGRRTRAQVAEAARAAEAARDPVRAAIKEARAVWDLRRERGGALGARELADAKRAAGEAGRAAWRSAREAQRAAREAARTIERTRRDEERRARRS